MEARSDGASIVVEGSTVRQQLYDASGVGTPTGSGVRLTWVEAVHLLDRGDIDAVGGDGLDALLADPPDPAAVDRWLVYRDLRSRGYYVSMAYDPGDPPSPGRPGVLVRPRGASPTSDEVAYRIGIVTETTSLSLSALASVTLAVVDDEGELTYLGVEAIEPAGTTPRPDWAPVSATTTGSRVLVPNPPESMIDPAFFGRSLGARGRLLNALEARYLEATDRLEVSTMPSTDDRRYDIYRDLRNRGCVPRSGLKFGADFRVYTEVTAADDPGHSAMLVDVRPADASETARALSRAVRLAGGVRKRHVIAFVNMAGDREYLGFERRRL